MYIEAQKIQNSQSNPEQIESYKSQHKPDLKCTTRTMVTITAYSQHKNNPKQNRGHEKPTWLSPSNSDKDFYNTYQKNNNFDY